MFPEGPGGEYQVLPQDVPESHPEVPRPGNPGVTHEGYEPKEHDNADAKSDLLETEGFQDDPKGDDKLLDFFTMLEANNPTATTPASSSPTTTSGRSRIRKERICVTCGIRHPESYILNGYYICDLWREGAVTGATRLLLFSYR